MFIDRATIHVKAGNGGHGVVSFRHEKFVPRGGPDGGDGGNGGSVILRADDSVQTLLDFTYRSHYHAESGTPGRGKKCHGRNGADLTIRVPVGTVVRDRDAGLQLRDLSQDGMTIVVAAGGKGGRGNAFFRSSTNQTPRQAEPGLPGEERWLRLELKLIADVGLAGMPNAGKSTLLARTTAARPKIADYPFTTIQPYLGIVELSDYRRFVMADIPGLIEGSHLGHGMGDEFLRHIERTRLIVHVIDMAPLSGPSPAEAYRIVRGELAAYSAALVERPHLIAANKMDLPEAAAGLEAFRREVDGEVFPISAVTGQGVEALLERAHQLLHGTSLAE
jgi:GTP-binding protein